ncbi:MAG TPA: hypothetical protein VD840_15140 [Sinorhizobium sp.]|nr:hypothetical protein [Sinorhizobium sp.]
MVRKLVYIVGLSHSGSTALDMLLTTGGKAVGLGQVWTVLNEDPATTQERICSCGAAATECALWQPVIDQLKRLSGTATPRDRYRLVLQSVDRLYGPEISVIDSSKHAHRLAILKSELPEISLTVLHNIKDVRPFTISTLDNSERKALGGDLPEKIFLQWYRDNRASYATAAALSGEPPLRVMYEGVCLATEAVAGRLVSALGEDYIDLDADLNCGHTHIISGNRMRLRPDGKAKRLTYDHRWMARSEWLRPYMLLPMVRWYNERCLRELAQFA